MMGGREAMGRGRCVGEANEKGPEEEGGSARWRVATASALCKWLH